jgi:serine/threonine-protein kinase
MDTPLRKTGTYTFGRFSLDPVRRTLFFDGNPVPLTARLFDTLLYFLQHPEKLVERGELEQAVWPGRVVEDGNLQKAVWTLRKALQDACPADDYIVTVTGRGFRFAMPVEWTTDGLSAPDPRPSGDAVAAVGYWGFRTRVAATLGIVFIAATMLLVVLRENGDLTIAFTPPPFSVAVMAFTNLSGDANQEYFSDGLSEELIDTLGRIGSLRVPARLSSFSFKGKQVPVGTIARELNVGTVLEGSVRRSGEHLHVTAQLVDARSGYQIWSNSYDRNEGDVLKVQSDIASSVAKALQVTMIGDDAAKLALGGTANAKAFDAYLRGMKLHNDGKPTSLRPALSAFDEALAIDPNYALAHVRRISTIILIAQGQGGSSPGDPAPKTALKNAVAEGRLAVSIAPDLAPAHTILGNALELTGDLAQAAVEHETALKLAPGDSWVNTMYGLFKLIAGDSAPAIAAAKRGVDLDPLSAEAYFNLGQVLVEERQPQEAMQAFRHADELGFSGPRIQNFRAFAAMEAGNHSTALAACASASPGVREECLAIEYHAGGSQVEAEKHLATLISLYGDDGASAYAQIYAQWGHIDKALHWLEVAYAQNPSAIIDIESRWLYDPLRETPRFKEIEQRMRSPH